MWLPFPLSLYVPGGADLPTLMQTPNFLKIMLYKPILRFVDFSCLSITVLLQKTRAIYVPPFNFGEHFFNKKFGSPIANVQKILIFAKKIDFSKKSQAYTSRIQKGQFQQGYIARVWPSCFEAFPYKSFLSFVVSYSPRWASIDPLGSFVNPLVTICPEGLIEIIGF